MWERYKKTFVGMQLMICTMTVVLFFMLHRQPAATGILFGTMQVGSIIGAAWASRLKRKTTPQALTSGL